MFYDIFESLCRENKIAPSALARKLGMSSSAPGRWRTGSSPDLETALKIADYFGVTIDYLVHGDDRFRIMSGTASNGAALLQGSHGNSVSVSHQSAGQEGAQAFERELLDIYRSLDLSDKLALLQTALTMKEKAAKKED